MKSLRKLKAFTIVEMSIVIAVIAILSAVMIPTIGGIIKKANKAADENTAANLTTQLALWTVNNGEIKNESDLRAAIGNDVYDSLEPKSAKYGYHYWYDVEEGRVILAKYDNSDDGIMNIESKTLTSSYNGEDVVFQLAAGGGTPATASAPTFSLSNPRSIFNAEGRNYFLMDRGGSEIITNLKAAETIKNNSDYKLAAEKLLGTKDEENLGKAIVDRMKTIAIGNENGVSFYGEEWGKPTQVHIPLGTETIGKNNTTLTEVKEVYIPNTLTKIDTGSLDGLPDDAIIYAEVVENVIKDYVASGSFTGVLEIPTGEQFAFIDDVLTKLGTTTTYETEYSVDLKSFKVSADAKKVDGAATVDLHMYDKESGKENTLHITGDAANVTLSTSDFIDEKNNATVRPVYWKKVTVVNAETGETQESDLGKKTEITMSFAELAQGDIIKVTAQDISYEIKVVKVGILSFTAPIGQNEGESFKAEAGTLYKANLYYNGNTVWPISPKVTSFTGCVNVSQEILEPQLSGTGASNLTIEKDGENYVLKTNDGVSGQFTANITITTKGKHIDGNALTITYELTFKESEFTVTDNANTAGNYGHTLVVGSGSSIALTTLFKSVGSTIPENIIVKQLGAETDDINTAGNASILNKNNSTDWTKWTVTPLCSSNLQEAYIGINGCVIKVKVAKDAKNATKDDGWANADGKDLVLLTPITTNTAISIKNGSTLYGNYQIIESSLFGQGKNFISVNAAHLKNVIIVGPVYPKAVSSSGGDYFCHGVVVTGNSTISDSYISGFRAPVRVNGYSGETVTLTNTVVDGGVYANIYVWCNTNNNSSASVKLVLNGCTTIQNGYDSTVGDPAKVIGAGIMLDTSANGSVTIDENTRQFNWFHEADKNTYSGTSDYYGELFSKKIIGNKYKFASVLHGTSGSKHAQVGIIWEKSIGSKNNMDCSDIPSEYTYASYSLGKTIYAWGLNPSSTGCTNSCSCEHTANNIKIGTKTFATYADLVNYLK